MSQLKNKSIPISNKQTRHAYMHMHLSQAIIFLDDNGPQEAETQDDLSGNRWLNLVAIQPEVAQPGNVVISGVIHGINGDGTDVVAINTWEDKGE